MPSSEEVIEARNRINEKALESLMKSHSKESALVILKHMNYEEKIKEAEKVMGPIYRGAYSPF